MKRITLHFQENFLDTLICSWYRKKYEMNIVFIWDSMIPGIIDIWIKTEDTFAEAKICKNGPCKVFWKLRLIFWPRQQTSSIKRAVKKAKRNWSKFLGKRNLSNPRGLRRILSWMYDQLLLVNYKLDWQGQNHWGDRGVMALLTSISKPKKVSQLQF